MKVEFHLVDLIFWISVISLYITIRWYLWGPKCSIMHKYKKSNVTAARVGYSIDYKCIKCSHIKTYSENMFD